MDDESAEIELVSGPCPRTRYFLTVPPTARAESQQNSPNLAAHDMYDVEQFSFLFSPNAERISQPSSTALIPDWRNLKNLFCHCIPRLRCSPVELRVRDLPPLLEQSLTLSSDIDKTLLKIDEVASQNEDLDAEEALILRG